MQPLTNSDFGTVQRFCQLMSEKIALVGLDVYVESNFREFVRLRRELSPRNIVNPSFDPDYSDLNLHNAFWLRGVDSDGRTVATMVQRVFDSDSLLDDILSLRLWHDRGRADVAGRFGAMNIPTAAEVTGRLGHSGGLWVHPDFRRRNLSGLFDHLSRGLLLKNLWFDHVTAVMLDDLAATGIGINQYGFPEINGRFEFDLLFGGKLYTLMLCHMSRAQTLQRMRDWLLFPDCNSVEALQEIRELLVS